MSRNYDNWERLVAAVIKREEIWDLCHQDSISPSICSEASSDLSSLTTESQIEAEWTQRCDATLVSLQHATANYKIRVRQGFSTPVIYIRNTTSHEVSPQHAFSQADLHQVRNSEGAVSKKLTFNDLVRSNELDELENRGQQNDIEPSNFWNSNATSATTVDYPNFSFSPYRPRVLEESSSSFPEAAIDDPLPAIEGLQISGEAFPGQQLQACGYSINGTTSCNFEWVHHLDDGSFNYVEGAKLPIYVVTADDIDTYLAIEVQPLGDRNQKSELVKVFANDNRKIKCAPEMQRCIEKTFYTGHASYRISLSTGYLDIWEPATLFVKRDGYSIKCSGPSGVVVTEKYSSPTNVTIPYGSPTEFSIFDCSGTEHILSVDSRLTDISGARDTIVLTLRLFILKAGEKRRKKRSLFFNK